MVALEEVPLVMPLAEWIWGGAQSEAVTPASCLARVPFLDAPCFSQLLSKALGVAIILGSCLNKMPIMANMMNSKSAAGISRTSLYGEAMVYTCCVFYGFLSGHPFTAYGENMSLLMQNVVLVLMAWRYSTGPVPAAEKVGVLLGFTLFCAAIYTFLPADQRYLLMSSTWPIMLYARGSQVVETFQVKHTGQLSIATTSLNLVGSIIRIGTTLQETGDMVVISGYLLSGGLTFLMFAQYFLYLENTRKQMADGDNKKKQS